MPLQTLPTIGLDDPNMRKRARETINELIKVYPESGTWTPTDASGAGLSITVNDARYVKIGSTVIASASITYPATADGADAKISGMPFALDANQSSRQGSVSFSSSATHIIVLPLISSAEAEFRVAAGGGNATNAQLTGALILFQLIYQTS